jgi:hypothetical protein
LEVVEIRLFSKLSLRPVSIGRAAADEKMPAADEVGEVAG